MPQSVVMGGNRGSITGVVDQLVSGKATPEEIKEKMEQQLRLQRAAHQQKRALETLKSPANSSASGNQLVKVTSNSNLGKHILSDRKRLHKISKSLIFINHSFYS